MKKEDKNTVIENLVEAFSQYGNFYITDISNLTVEKTNQLRKKCYNSKIRLRVAKNTLIRKALEKIQTDHYSELFPTLKGSSAIMFCETANEPARVIKDFRKQNDKPVLKSAFIDASVYIGDNQIDTLASLKSKNELIADIITLLQSPVKNVISALQSSGNQLTGILQTLEKRGS
ncbi:MAG: 50S ribosomal protein L10 [Bacteroidia bacterium]|nr:50S ribosomal protein L10 [Bacteroidia bacterium]MCZ2277022.1 50S ribosomal protein L10 [Bacteroidia bacterium]